MCPCGFENELIGYIADDGSILEDIFEKIAQSMIDGKCPHVTSKIQKDWIRWTSVSAAHVAVAAGAKLKIGEVVRLEFLSKFKNQGIFNLELYAIALLKKKFEIVSYYYQVYMEYFKLETDNNFVLFYKKLENKQNSVIIRVLPRIIAFLQTGDQKLLEYLLKPKHYSWGSIALGRSYFEEALHYAWRYNLSDAYETLLTSENLNDKLGYGDYRLKHLRALCMYDQTDALADFLECKPPTKLWLFPCYVLERPKCKEVLSKYQTPDETKHLTGKAKTELLIILLESFFEEFKDEIITALKQIPNYREECRDWLLTCYSRRPHVMPEVLETLLALVLSAGDDEENQRFIENIMIKMLDTSGRLFHSSWTREKLKLLLKMNTATEYLKDYITKLVGWGDVLDKSSKKGSRQFKQENFEEVYQLDAKEHGIFGYDGEGFALNFATPFLLESGVKIPRGNLEANALLENRHPAEITYIVNYLESIYEPTPLAKLCRDTLRQYFCGLRLHKYLEMTACPNKIQDFILMNYSLLPNNRVSYKMSHVARQSEFGESDHERGYGII